jgi:acyl-CoA reductase-like NAD-dependent aldehyde dehydrogenase
VLAPWNYPYLTAVNAVVPALMAGNPVLLKHSAQTPLVAEAFDAAAKRAALPPGLLQHLHLDHGQVARTIGDARIAHVCFTGSVEGGRDVHRAAAERFIAVGLELGGKDPAYVRADAAFDHAVETVVDGAFYNAGQSCCGIERVYVAEQIYQPFVDAVVAAVERYKLGNPLDPETTLGPMARQAGAEAVRAQVNAAVASGARALVDEGRFGAARVNSPYLAPQVLVEVDHSMEIMREETFGPVVGIMKVASDDEAIALMNDSRYGLSAAVFTTDTEAAIAIGDQIETGTCFMNRCDYLDPGLAWVGVKDTGRGCTLSRIGYEHLTRPKSFNLKTNP